MTIEQKQELVSIAEEMADAIHYVRIAQEGPLFLTKGGDMLEASIKRYQDWRTGVDGKPKTNWTPVIRG